MKVKLWMIAGSLFALTIPSALRGSEEPVPGISAAAADPDAPPDDTKKTTPGRNRPKPGDRPKPADPASTPPADPGQGTTPGTKPRTSVPAAPAEPALTTIPVSTEPGPYLTREKPKNWTFNVRIEVLGTTYDEIISDPRGGSARMPRHDTWDFKTLTMVFPILNRTASSDIVPNSWQGKLRVNDKIVDEKIESSDIIDNGHSGTRLVKFTAVDGTGRAADLDFTYNMTCYRTKLDEAAAMKVGWPKTGWPSDAASTFKPQMFIDYAPDPESGGDLAPFKTEPLVNLVNSWLRAERINSPKDVPPVKLAKIIAGGVVRDFQPSGNGISYNRKGQLEGIALQPVPVTIDQRKGSEFDIVCVFVAACRQAGLPTRLVLGWQKENDGDDDKFLDKGKGTAKLRAWAEFAIFDENFQPRACMNWIPVDVASLRKTSSRPPPLERPWRFFGTVEDLEGTTPFAFHFHPPTTVRAYGSPGFWGWWMTPENPPRAQQNLLFNVTRTAVRGSDKENEGEQDKSKKNQPKRKN